MSRLVKCRNDFMSSLDQAVSFIGRCDKATKRGSKALALTVEFRFWCTEAALLKCFVAMECFLEVSFGLYITGERLRGRPSPQRLKRLNATLPVALETVRGDQRFVGWNDAETIRSRAEKWFRNGEPFRSALVPAAPMLNYLKSARNVIAHGSDSAEADFANRTRKLFGSVPKRLLPGAVLRGPPPSTMQVFSKPTLLEEGLEVMRCLGTSIVP